MEAYQQQYDADAGVEELSALAQAVVQELDDRRVELIAAMWEVWDGGDDGAAKTAS